MNDEHEQMMRTMVNAHTELGDLISAADADAFIIGNLNHACHTLEAALAETRKALAGLLGLVDRNTCRHEETYRGGLCWTICAECGEKWGDHQGGFVPYVDPPEIAHARATLKGAVSTGTA